MLPANPFMSTSTTSRAESSVTIGGESFEIALDATCVFSAPKSPRSRAKAGSTETLLSGEGSSKPKSNDAR